MPRFDPEQLRRALRARRPMRVPIVPPLREAAVAMVLVPAGEGDVALLFIKRSEYPDDPWSGQIALPGGRRDRADPDLLATAIRETEEETGVGLAPRHLVGELDDLSPVSPHLPPIVVRPFVFALSSIPEIRLSHEVAESLWVPRSQLLERRTEEQVTARDRTLVMPGYRIGPHYIWGMTERIVTPFLQLTWQ
jgi:8-oxo-dGTP pyrophosphatase MutT (NUDIX family)